ncbi:MAG: hypothetical protein U5J64_10115 [Halobacteriales archaeon]|nr:hypothetical protein [Halobacteriales archaeon]
MVTDEDTADTVEDALLEELRLLHDELGVPPRTIDMGKHGRFSPALYSDRFGSWRDALEEAGIEGEPRRPPEDAEPDLESTREEVRDTDEDADTEGTEGDDEETTEDDLDEHQRLILRNAGRVVGVPTPADLRARGHSVNEIIDEYGTWKEALASVGIELPEKMRAEAETRRRSGRKRERLLEEVEKYTNVNGRKPTETEVRASDWMSSVEEYEDEFGAVWKAVDTMRVDGDETDTERPSEDELVGELKRYYLRNGEVPSRDEIQESTSTSEFSCYVEVFGDLRTAVETAGLSKYVED